MKMIGFAIMAIVLGGAVAAYILMPKDEDTVRTVGIIKFVLAVISLTMVGLFTLAMISSSTSFKLF